jgi:hypothetical protein
MTPSLPATSGAPLTCNMIEWAIRTAAWRMGVASKLRWLVKHPERRRGERRAEERRMRDRRG